ncbi:plasmid pRiA4b ORF-3 family protein [Pelagibacterium sp.]|uniref:plasmid pRiA4b ORF-3 family protein n=1 Tax=Pelagibacterium sp. TaxID=1967288 RepID=UPI003BACBAF3
MSFELEIRLIGIEPPVWRRVVVASSISLDELHAVIQGAMGWEDRHLHMFEIAGQRYEIPESDEMGPEPGCLDERSYTLGEAIRQTGEFLYVYDFGDNWRHAIQAKFVKADTEPFPSCLAGARACPPEDCGGAYDYPDFVERLTNVDHPDHAETKAWAPIFEPEIFNVSQANSLIAALYTWCQERKERHRVHH